MNNIRFTLLKDRKQKPPQTTIKSNSTSLWKRMAGWTVLIVVVVLVLATVNMAIAAYYALSLKQQAENTLTVSDPAGQNDSLNLLGIVSDTQTLKDVKHLLWWAHFHMTLAKPLYVIPIVGNNVRQAANLIDTAYQIGNPTLDIAIDMSVPIKKLTAQADGGFNALDENSKRDVLAVLGSDKNKRRGQKIEQAYLATEKRIHNPPCCVLVPQLKEAQKILADNIDTIKQASAGLLVATNALPIIAGYPDQTNLLLLLMNNTEIRSGGGFIGTYGTITTKDGGLQSLATDNVYNLDHQLHEVITPPEYISAYMNQPRWYFRDANTSPDFPTNAERLFDFYQRSTGSENFDGAIAFTPTLIAKLLDVVGPVTVSIGEQAYKFTSKNFVTQLQQHVELDYLDLGLSVSDRKDIIADISEIIMTRLFTLPQNQWPKLLQIVQDGFAEKHVMMYLKDDRAEQALSAAGLAAELHQTKGDFVGVFDVNLAALKTDRVMDRAINYHVDLSDPTAPTATLAITYTNNGTFTDFTTRYRTYAQVYVTKGSNLLLHQGAEVIDHDNTEGKVIVSEDLSYTTFAYFKSIEPGTSETITLTYQLPSTVRLGNSYSLFVQKQSGTIAHDLTVTIIDDKNRIFPDDSNKSQSSNISTHQATYSDSLLTDKQFNLTFK